MSVAKLAAAYLVWTLKTRLFMALSRYVNQIQRMEKCF
jgi:hypothetical protein